MVTIDLDRLNDSSPYKVILGKENLVFYFVTDHQIFYKVEFTMEDLLAGVEAYQFSIVNAEHKSSPRDKKLNQTIVAIIRAFFEASNTVLLYICETGDGKQKMRSRLFQSWFETEVKGIGFTTSSAMIVDEDGVDNYATIIMRNDYPKIGAVLAQFNATAQLLSNKPEGV